MIPIFYKIEILISSYHIVNMAIEGENDKFKIILKILSKYNLQKLETLTKYK